MKVNDILKKINDPMLYIEIINKETGSSYGIFKRNDPLLVYSDKKKKTIKSLNVQYINNKRILIIYIND